MALAHDSHQTIDFVDVDVLDAFALLAFVLAL